jgi:hypothetical protein
VLSEGTGLAKHGVNQRCLSVVNVSHNCNVSKVFSDCQGHKKLPLYLRTKAPSLEAIGFLPEPEPNNQLAMKPASRVPSLAGQLPLKGF